MLFSSIYGFATLQTIFLHFIGKEQGILTGYSKKPQPAVILSAQQ
jgi:hypothetical protein